MDELSDIKKRLQRAIRDVQNAEDELAYRKKLFEEQQKKMTTLLDYRDECMTGLTSAKSSGLSIVQIREYQLLLRHLGSVLDDQSYKIDLCNRNYEQARTSYDEKKALLEQQQKLLEQEEKLRAEQYTDGMTGEGGEQPGDENSKGMQENMVEETSENSPARDAGLAGRRLKTGSQ